LTTQTEIEAAVEAITAAEIELAVGKLSAETYATLALEAAERVRPRRDLTAAARMRQSRAKKRAERAVTALSRDMSSPPLRLALIDAAAGNVQANALADPARAGSEARWCAGGRRPPAAARAQPHRAAWPVAARTTAHRHPLATSLPAARNWLREHHHRPPNRDWKPNGWNMGGGRR
jgi:hypothetical protein